MFPGPILATTNCVLEPPKSYKDRLFTTNEAGLSGEEGQTEEACHCCILAGVKGCALTLCPHPASAWLLPHKGQDPLITAYHFFPVQSLLKHLFSPPPANPPATFSRHHPHRWRQGLVAT